MATSTTNYSFSLPEVGGDTDQWGSQLNANWTLADSTIKTIADSVVDVTLTGNDYLTISGQAIAVGDVDLTADVTGTLPVGSGGTGLAAIGSANQVLGVNSGGTALEYKTLSTGGTVTSVAVTGSDGIEIDSGSPITSSGTIALGINSTTLSTHLGLGSLATQSSVTESQISDLQSYITASSTDTLTNKSGNISQWTNDSGYLTAETNNLSTVSGTLGTANGGTGLTAIGTANQVLAVNTGATALEFQTISITESQISDLQSYLTAESNDLSAAVTWANVPDVNITQSSVTQHQAALSITESQISDLGNYQPSDAGLTSIAGLTTAADKMIYTTASDVYAVTALTTAGRALLDDADAAAQRTTLGLGSLATQSTITESQISDLQSYLTAVALPITDSAGNNVLSESSSTVTLTADEANVGSNALVVDASGNVGVGVSPTQRLSIKNSTGNGTLDITTGTVTADSVRIQSGGSVTNYLEYRGYLGHVWFVDTTEQMRIDSSGNVGISASINPYSGCISNAGNGAQLWLASNAYYDGSNWRRYLAGGTTSTLYSSNEQGEHRWYSNASGTAGSTFTPNERMRIDFSGNVKINNLSANSDVQTDASKNLITTSDARLKNEIGLITKSGVEIINQIIPKYFSWKNDENNTQQLGFFAQDVYPVLPEAAPRALKYTEVGRDENDEPILEQVFDEDGNPDYEWGFTDRPIIAMCVKAIQEQQAIIESQQSQIDALTVKTQEQDLTIASLISRIEALETPAE